MRSRDLCVLCLAAGTTCAAQDNDWVTLGWYAGSGPLPIGSPRWIASQDEVGSPITFSGQSSVVTRLGRIYGLGKSAGINRLYNIRNDTGQVLWGSPVPAPAFESWTTPTVDSINGTVLVASGAFLTAVRATTGAVVWQTQLNRNTAGATPAVTIDRGPADRAFITDFDGFGGGGRLYCINVDRFNAATNPYEPGQIVWSVVVGNTAANSPVCQFDRVYVASASDSSGTMPGQIRAFPVDATVPPPALWTFTNPVNAGFYGGVVIAYDGSSSHIYAASYAFNGGQLAANLVKVHAESGILVWSTPSNRTDTMPVVMTDGKIALSSGIRGFGSIPSVQCFRDHGATVSILWDTAIDSWEDLNQNTQMDPGEYLDVGGWTVQAVAVRDPIWPADSPHRLYAGVLPAGSSTANACPRMLVLDLTKQPADAGFVMDTLDGAGSSPAAIAGGMITAGPAGLHAVGKKYCYANCDGSSIAPILNANDFQCFLGDYAVGSFNEHFTMANCDGSTAVPIMNANDFLCFLNTFAAGCP